MKPSIYRATKAIPELGARTGDLIIVNPPGATSVAVVRKHYSSTLAAVHRHLKHLLLISGDPAFGVAVPESASRRSLALLDGGSPRSVHLVIRPIPDLDIREGDLIVYAREPQQFPRMTGRSWYLSLEDYQILADATREDLGGYFAALSSAFYGNGLERFLRNRRSWGRQLKVWHSRLAVVRPPWESVSETIHALSDDGAIFELIHDAGGRMPEEEDDAKA